MIHQPSICANRFSSFEPLVYGLRLNIGDSLEDAYKATDIGSVYGQRLFSMRQWKARSMRPRA